MCGLGPKAIVRVRTGNPHRRPDTLLSFVVLAGKWMCAVNTTLSQQPCVVFSMGSNGQTDFEEAILERAPHCVVRSECGVKDHRHCA